MTVPTTGQLALPVPTDGDDVEAYFVQPGGHPTVLQQLDDLFHNSTGHRHDFPGGGAPIQTGGIADGAITAAKLAAAVGNFGAYTAWSPAITQGGTTPTFTNSGSRYTRIGNQVHVYANLQATSAGVAANPIIISTLPVPPKNFGGDYVIGNFNYLQTAVDRHNGAEVATSSALVQMIGNKSTGGGYLGNTGGPSFAVAIGDIISMNLLYEASS